MESPPPRRVRHVRDWIWIPWSVVAWLCAFGIMLGTSLVSLLLVPFLPFARFQLIFPAPAMKTILRLTLSRIRVRYHPAFDRSRVSVYCQNHVSMLDAHAGVTGIPQVFCGLENAAHLRVPAYGWLLRTANAIPVSRTAGRLRLVQEAFVERKSRGISVLTFPEGHRTLDGRVKPLRRGVFMSARHADLPVVPLAVHGMFDVLPKGTWIIKPGRIDIYVGPQIEVAGLTEEQLGYVVDAMHEILSAWAERHEDVVDRELEQLEARIRSSRQVSFTA